MSDGLVPILLNKDYGDHAAGTVLRCDPVRAAWLREHDYEAQPEPEAEPEKPVRKARKAVG